MRIHAPIVLAYLSAGVSSAAIEPRQLGLNLGGVVNALTSSTTRAPIVVLPTTLALSASLSVSLPVTLTSALPAIATGPFDPTALIKALDTIRLDLNKAANPVKDGDPGVATSLTDTKLLEQLTTLKVAASVNALGAVASVNFTPGSISVQAELDICRIVEQVLRSEQRFFLRLENDCTNGHGPIGSSAQLALVLVDLGLVHTSLVRIVKLLEDLRIIPQCLVDVNREEANLRETFTGLVVTLHNLDNVVSTNIADQVLTSAGLTGGVTGPLVQGLAGKPNR